LNADSSAFDGFDETHDLVWMAEATSESTHVWSHKARIAIFISAMRHFRDLLYSRGWRLDYARLDDTSPPPSLEEGLIRALKTYHPKRIVMVRPGTWRICATFTSIATQSGIPLELRPDLHFMTGLDEFNEFLSGRKQPRMEHFYRIIRRKTGILMDNSKPLGDTWNYDSSNRQSFGKTGPGDIPSPSGFPPDEITSSVCSLVMNRFPDHPGCLATFDWPVTREQALLAVDDFISNRLKQFGPYQDAMWTNEPFLFHSRLSSSLNLKLLTPRDVITRTMKAFQSEGLPLPSVEGFIRQIIGWREFVRGIYWASMPEYINNNFLDASLHLPEFYWTGETDMACMRHTIRQTLEYSYAHHIQRLMVTGLFALLLGVSPDEVHQWYLAVYVDAVEWVEVPNTVGMSQFADGGIMASKPYIASGNYISRMSNYCDSCRYDPRVRTGDIACPFTVLYWDFLDRHAAKLLRNQRMRIQLNNLGRISNDELKSIRKKAEAIKSQYQ
jgi:deoxyribodipyrimidine photolyase-related protein